VTRGERGSSAGFAGATTCWGEVRKGGGAPLRGNAVEKATERSRELGKS
jgi:hypothetical protein